MIVKGKRLYTRLYTTREMSNTLIILYSNINLRRKCLWHRQKMLPKAEMSFTDGLVFLANILWTNCTYSLNPFLMPYSAMSWGNMSFRSTRVIDSWVSRSIPVLRDLKQYTDLTGKGSVPHGSAVNRFNSWDKEFHNQKCHYSITVLEPTGVPVTGGQAISWASNFSSFPCMFHYFTLGGSPSISKQCNHLNSWNSSRLQDCMMRGMPTSDHNSKRQR